MWSWVDMRLLIDCSGVHFRASPSGIPRVVTNYVEHGRRWGRSRGVQVIPVACLATGTVVLAGMRPGSPLSSWRELPYSQRFLIGLLFLLRQATRELGQYLSGVGLAAGRLLGAIVKSRHVRPMLKWLTDGLSWIARWPYRCCDALYNRAIAITPLPDDIVFMPAYWHDLPQEVLTGLSARCRSVVVLVHDLLPVTHPQFYEFPWRDEFKDNALHMLATVNGVLAISRYSAQAVSRLARRHGLSVDLGLAYNGLDPLLPPGGAALRPLLQDLLTQPQGALLMVGTLEPKKGHALVLDAMDMLWDQGDERALIVVGRSGWMCEPLARRIRGSRRFGRKLFWLTDVGDAELAASYGLAQALVFMSEAEGFGLPMIEAASRGCPVVVTDALWAREILDGAGRYVPPDDPLALVGALRALPARSPSGAAFQWPTWDVVVPLVMDALVQLGRGERRLAASCPLAAEAAAETVETAGVRRRA